MKTFTAILWVSICLLLSGCPEVKEVETKPTAVAVRVTTPLAAEEIDLSAPVSGVVRTAGQVQISFQVPGVVEKVLVDEGDEVTNGQSLAVLDTRLYTAAVTQASAAHDAAAAGLALAEEGTRHEDIAMAEAGLASAEAVLAKAKADYERTAMLFEEGVVARQSLDAAESGLAQAHGAVKAATEQLNKARSGPRPQEIDQARANLAAAIGTLLQAETQLEYATLDAPESGTVVMRQLEVGQSVAAGLPVFELADLRDLEIWTEVPECDLAKVSVGDTASCSFPAAPEATAIAEIISIAPSAQMQTRGFPVKLSLAEVSAEVAPGMVALVHFEYIEVPQGVVIPRRSIVDGAVFVVEGGKAKRVPVTELLDKGDLVFVDGLALDTQVMVNGQYYVEDGNEVNIVDSLGIEEITKLDRD